MGSLSSVIGSTQAIVVGQRVYSALYGGRFGVVVAIHGDQAPSSIRSLGGVLVTGGAAKFDIVFDDGSRSNILPECILRGVQWKIFDEVVPLDAVIDAVQHAKAAEAMRRERKEADEARRQAEREAYRREYDYLTPKEDRPTWSPGRLAAANLRIELKRSWPKVKFRVTSDFNSVNVRWSMGPTEQAVKELGAKYEAGSFDGMTDCYNYDPDATFSDVFGDPRYVFERRDFDDATLETVARSYCQLTGKPFVSMDSILWDGHNGWITAMSILRTHEIPAGMRVVGLEDDPASAGLRVVDCFRLVLEKA